MAKKKYYGIKYPFTSEGVENYFIDLNESSKDYARSILMHLIFTPKGQKLRDYEFGTNLIRFIFEPSDNMTFNDIKNEVSNVVSKYLKGVVINDIQVAQSDNDYSNIYVRIDYTIKSGNNTLVDSFVTKI